jgi:hypothetical protein
MSEEEKIPIDKLIRVFIKMRDRCKELEAQKAEVEEQMDVVKSQILDQCNAVGANSLSTPYGRITRKLITRYWTTDWEAMHAFIKDNEAMDLLERRIHQTNLKTFLEEYPDKIPPGLNSDSKYDVVVYRK